MLQALNIFRKYSYSPPTNLYLNRQLVKHGGKRTWLMPPHCPLRHPCSKWLKLNVDPEEGDRSSSGYKQAAGSRTTKKHLEKLFHPRKRVWLLPSHCEPVIFDRKASERHKSKWVFILKIPTKAEVLALITCSGTYDSPQKKKKFTTNDEPTFECILG